MKKFKLSISTPIGKNYETEDAVSINAFLLEGRIGVLANHSPVISSLRVSDFTIELEDGTKLVGAIDGGVFSVVDKHVNILTTRFDFSNEIDVESTKEEIKEITYHLQDDVKKAEEESLGNRLKYSEVKLKIVS